MQELFPDEVTWFSFPITQLIFYWTGSEFVGKAKVFFMLQVEDVVIVEDLKKWQELVNERDALKWKLEHAKVSFPYFGFMC